MNQVIRCIICLCLSSVLWSCDDNSTLFTRIDASDTGLVFSNRITPNDSINILDYEYIYNGGGVGIGDFDKDGLEDLFFTGSMVPNALYLNKGDFRFEEITLEAGITDQEKWSAGVAVVDINADGWQDIYICNTTYDEVDRRTNNLYINQGLDENGVPQFIDKAQEYGLALEAYSINSAFFDYDNDGDLDVMVIINENEESRFPSRYQNKTPRKKEYQRVDILLRNDFSDALGHPVFTDVSEQAGINVPGYSLGINICDINLDGWKDIYISNDFLSNDVFYINQKDGTFLDKSKQLLKHTSHSAMGNDVVDINNDGLQDIIALDMLPEDNYRQKRLLGPNNYVHYLNAIKYDYTLQFVRNTLQLNRGVGLDSLTPQFSDIAMFSGISATDWSWTPLVADFNMDGNRDIIVTNGFPKDVTDHDYIDFKADVARYASKEMMLMKIPEIKSKNCAFENQGDLKFSNQTESWGLNDLSFSNGAAYADLDNDGDLDFVINNIDDSTFVYRNNVISAELSNRNYLKINLKGTGQNLDALGAIVKVFAKDRLFQHDHTPFRGYLSTYSKTLYFGLGDVDRVDSIMVTWPNNKYSVYKNIDVNQTLELSIEDASASRDYKLITQSKAFALDANFEIDHQEDDYVDYNLQPLLPYKLSQYGPAMSVVDVNSDGLEDIYVSGSAFRNGTFLMQTKTGTLKVDSFLLSNHQVEEQSSLFMDADGDGDQDMILGSGSYEFAPKDTLLQDQLFKNNNGRFELLSDGLPPMLNNTSCLKAADFDRDGDLDIFAGGGVLQDEYPYPNDSHLLINNSNTQNIKFDLATEDQLEVFANLSMVNDALWTDYNGDGWIDLVTVSHFNAPTFFRNDDGFLVKESAMSGVDDKLGFWNSITGADLDNDGDIDYLLGNFGQNLFNDINAAHPYRIYAKDFDENGSVDMLPFAYFKKPDGELREFPVSSRLDMTKEINSIRRRFKTFEGYSISERKDFIADSTVQKSDVFMVNELRSAILWNDDLGFQFEALPADAQLAPIYGTQIIDVNDDGLQDLVMIGNEFGNEIFFGRLDALNGLVLLNKGDREFTTLTSYESGFYVPGNGKSLVTSIDKSGRTMIVASENMGKIRKFDHQIKRQVFEANTFDAKVFFYNDAELLGSRELYFGDSFGSQSTRRFTAPISTTRIEIIQFDGTKREIKLDGPI